MPSGKYIRHEKRPPSFYVIATISTFVVFCFIGLWLLRSPSEPQVAEEAARLPIDGKLRTKDNTESGSQIFEEGPGDIPLENEEKVEEDSQESPMAGNSNEEKGPTETETKPKEKEPLDLGTNELEQMESRDEKEELPEDDKKLEAESVIEEGDSSKDAEASSQQNSELEESGGVQSEIQIETNVTAGTWATQASESKEEKAEMELKDNQETGGLAADEGTNPVEMEVDVDATEGKKKEKPVNVIGKTSKTRTPLLRKWDLCAFEGAADFVPCLDNKKAIKAIGSTKHFEHRERHCPDPPPTCLPPLPKDYSSPIRWPQSRNEIWFSNVPHPGLVSYKKDQNWVKKSGDRLIFPGGGTQFTHGAFQYIDFIEQILPEVSWGKRTRVILDVGCGVASFGGFLFDKDVLTMSFAPKDEHEAQIQLALERGIPAILSVMGTQRLPFPSNVYDVVHCARCRVHWHAEGGKLLLELNRVLRPGGYFVWSATPVYRKDEEDAGIWKAMVALTAAMCWELVTKQLDKSSGVGIAVYHKPTTNFCYDNRNEASPPMCDEDDKSDAAWYIPMTACIHRVPSKENARGTEWPQDWPLRLTTAPNWLNSEKGLYGKPAAADFRSDTEHWRRVVANSYMHGLGIDWSNIRNMMDMKAVYGGFAAALSSQAVWVMNVVQFDEADTLPVIFDRGLFGIYHDWCESFSSYPRTYDLLHSDHLFGKLKNRCNIVDTVVEMDRLLRPEGWAIVRDKVEIINEIQSVFVSLQWDIHTTYVKGKEGLLAVQKRKWRPDAAL